MEIADEDRRLTAALRPPFRGRESQASAPIETKIMDDNQRIADLFAAIDRRDSKAFGSFLAPACRFRFGNGPAVAGREPIEAFVDGFFDSIKGLSHEVVDVRSVPGGKVCHGNVSYTRKNNTVPTVPFANILKMNDEGMLH